jgi:hypothetical protein
VEFEIIGDPGAVFTDTPRDLTPDEIAQIKQVSRIAGVKLHRTWTNSTLAAAVRCVDTIRAA